jgi:hypothetical protein
MELKIHKGPEPDLSSDNGSGQTPESDKKILEIQTEIFEGMLRRLRAECQNLRDSFIEISQKNDGTDKNACTVETLAVHETLYQNNGKQIDEILSKIEAFFLDCPSFYSKGSDLITHISNRWERIKEIHPDYQNPPANIGDILKKSSDYLCDMVYHCDRLTVPRRVTKHMASLKPGYALDFHEEFDDEFCSKEQAQNLLDFLARHPAYLQGIIDPENGLIYKADPKGKRWPSYARIIGAALLGGFIAILGITIAKGALGLPVLSTLAFMAQYVMPFCIILCGSVAHIIVDALKEKQSETKHPLKAVDDWLLWIHIRETLILKGIAVICIGFIVLVLSFGLTDVLTFFVAGYSIDSIGDIFVNRFDAILVEKADALKKTLTSP